MHTITAFLVLSLTAAAPGPVRLAAPGLSSPNMKPEQLSFYSEHLAQQLVSRGLEVVTAKDINSLLSMERQKQLMGCDEPSNSCMAELANALGTDAIVNGEIAKVGNSFQVNLKVIAPGDGKRLAAYSARASSEEAVLDELNAGAAALAQGVFLALRPGQQTASSSPLRPLGWAGIVVGAVALGGGVGALVFSQGQAANLRPAEPILLSDAQSYRDSGKTAQTLGVALVATGAVLAAAGVAVLVLSVPSQPAVKVELSTTGSSVLARVTF